MGGSKWLKVKIALGLKLNSCLYVPRTIEGSPAAAPPTGRLSDAVVLSHTPRDSDYRGQMPTTPTPSSSGLLLPKHSSKSSKNVCAICLSTMKPGHGHAIFTAECTHSFHFHCIASNVKHGKQSCPVCRAKWKEIPIQSSSSGKSQHNSTMQAPRRTPSSRPDPTRRVTSLFHAAEPAIFDDDDEVVATNSPDKNDFNGPVEVKTYPEVSAVPKLKSLNGFSILVHLKAPITSELQHSRAPVDLVTVLDVSGSMAGTKLALLKRAMGFVIQNLGPSDRLSVIAFSSSARRLFPLRRMTENGRQEALQTVNALTSNGGTNISEGLRKAAKVLTDCKWKNPFGSIILLSDGQETYARSDHYQSFHIPIHSFGFGADHDSASMHSISEYSGGTFSFIEAEGVIQDAFAQCIGGLLSVVLQGLKVEIECIDPNLKLVSIKSGSYRTVLASDKRRAMIEVGDLYADEERDFLITTNIPICEFGDETSLIKAGCRYKHPISKNLVSLDSVSDVKIRRPVSTGQLEVSMEVDRERNRLRSAEAMSEAKAAAERGDLTLAVSVLGKCREALSESVSARAGDRLCAALDAELKEMQERMANQHVYERSGRAYVLSGLSSHSWQRATTRGDSTDGSSLLQAYQTQSMVDMVNLSQTMVLGSPTRLTIRPTRTQPR
ncbi:hypothetical protein CASFOL_037654 [Castilleja foliolosa]|uniref:Uncharacterized protein n=1 Tax=Castilleja foliolosa TaxID=1961234 RepID=A0ABD3BPD8_9LAMI